jgi:hypothetical protein
MTNDELRAAGQLMIDFADGKVGRVEYRERLPGIREWELVRKPAWNWSYTNYRAAPEPTYRPYTPEEAVGLVKKDFVRKKDGTHWRCKSVEVCQQYTYCKMWQLYDLTDSYETYAVDVLNTVFTHLDGSPCGVEVGE